MSTIDSSLVAQLPLFAGLDAKDLDALLLEARSQRFAKNSNIFEQGQEAHSFFVLLEGHIRASKVTPTGQRVVVRYIVPGEIFGIATAIGLAHYPATATAVKDSAVLAWPSAAWPRLIKKYPALASHTLQTVGGRLQDSHTHVIEMATEQVEHRVARALLRLAEQAGRRVDEGVEIDFPVSRQDIAEMTGTTLHTVSRILSAWESQGLTSGGRQRIVICNLPKLSALAESEPH